MDRARDERIQVDSVSLDLFYGCGTMILMSNAPASPYVIGCIDAESCGPWRIGFWSLTMFDSRSLVHLIRCRVEAIAYCELLRGRCPYLVFVHPFAPYRRKAVIKDCGGLSRMKMNRRLRDMFDERIAHTQSSGNFCFVD